MACDICGKRGVETESLNSMLVTGAMSVICHNCAKKADKMLDKFRHMAWRRTKKKLYLMQKKSRSLIKRK